MSSSINFDEARSAYLSAPSSAKSAGENTQLFIHIALMVLISKRSPRIFCVLCATLREIIITDTNPHCNLIKSSAV
ncbi:MAG: BC10 family protein [Bacteroidetes bacterium]|nr:BC10 family protein [Bacteroidota bacterium]MBK8364396.1 BC10 family protein [Bacteroidota bacterium]MBK9415399.1 BC10 family protein [Bacteroidota bacterium]MBP6426584.1 BC10 family protein [Bacteroidia bacterium]MBP6658155.1 BC10 family protein [Bacteroidia bacterium]